MLRVLFSLYAAALSGAHAEDTAQPSSHRVLWGCPGCVPGGGASVYLAKQWEALEELTADGVEVVTKVVTTPAELYDAVGEAAPHQVLTTVEMSQAVQEVAPRLPDVIFTLIDAAEVPDEPNVGSVIFREDQAGYLAGYLAGLQSSAKHVACLAGMAFTGLVRFRNGFQAGARAACPACRVDGFFVSDFNDAALGERTAAELVARGADVVFGAAGSTGSSGILSVADPAFVVGVDVDEYHTTFAQHHNTSKAAHLLGSAVKGMQSAVDRSVRAARDKQFTPGVVVLDVTVDGVRLSPCHEGCGAIAPATQAQLKQLLSGLKSGVTTTGLSPATGAVQQERAAFAQYPLGDHFGAPQVLHQPTLVATDGVAALILDGGADADGWETSSWYSADVHAVDTHKVASVVHNNWTGTEGVPPVRESFAAAAIGDAVYMYGGRGDWTHGDMWRWSIPCSAPGLCGVDPVWVHVNPAGGVSPTPRHGHSLTAAGEQLLTFGGRGPSGELLQDLWVFNATNATWAALPAAHPPKGREKHGAVAWAVEGADGPNATTITVGGVEDTAFLFVFGGRAVQALSDLQVYGMTSGAWGVVTPVGGRPGGRWDACVAAAGGHIIVAGGVGDAGVVKDAWAYSIQDNQWTDMADAPDGNGTAWGLEGPLSCYAKPAAPVEVVQVGRPLYANQAPHRIFVAAAGSTDGGALQELTFPAIRCVGANLRLTPSGLSCRDICDDGSCAAAPFPVWVFGVIAAVVVVAAAGGGWRMSAQRRQFMRLYNNNQVATDCAVAIASMRLEELDHLYELRQPNSIQKAFIEIVNNLKEYRKYMPDSVLVGATDSEEETRSHGQSSAGSAASAGMIGLTVMRSGPAAGGGSSDGSRNTFVEVAAYGKAAKASLAIGVATKKASFCFVNVVGWLAVVKKLTSEELAVEYAALAGVILKCFSEARGSTEFFFGDRFVCSFNAIKHVSGHCMAAASAAVRLAAAAAPRQLSIGAVSGKIRAGNLGTDQQRRFTSVSPILPWGQALERRAKGLGVSILADAHFVDAVTPFYTTRCVDLVTYAKISEGAVLVSQVLGKATVGEGDEWMYVMANAASKNPYYAWDQCVQALLGGDAEKAREGLHELAETVPHAVPKGVTAALMRHGFAPTSLDHF
eukprot:TRINITY_DN16498_c0_g1_i1.p1 TRINITY_DN16498_c0_g1~~TRINITY_DN16498_c0_g1_i1.p1  ORF type:complete len:1143 (+),score=359.41 TRINITY_DN16498_c0_g1_i1:65-3493(+)